MSTILASVDQRTQLAGHNRLELLLFRLSDGQRFGINVFKVQEVIQCPPLTHVPHSHPVVRGIAHLRGKTIPVMDLAQAIGAGSLGDTTGKFVVITEYNRTVQGFLVGGVDRIVNMNWTEILPPPTGASGRQSYLTAVTRVDNELVEIIDVEKVLSEVIGINEDMSQETLSQVEPKGEEAVTHHILVADDSSVARNQIKRTLDRLGFECTLVRDGLEAINQLKAWAKEGSIYDRLLMVISDVEMPEMDGYTLTKHIRQDPAMDDLYVLLHTSLSGVFNQSMVRSVGANEFIAKFQPDVLAKSVLEQVKARQAAHAA